MIQRLLWFVQHFFTSQGLHLLHSPFVFEFATEVLPYIPSEAGSKIEALRKTLLTSTESIEVLDLGAGSATPGSNSKTRSLAKIAATSASGRRKGELLYRICRHYQPKRCLEFGTNLGLSALYQVMALEDSQFVTMEGSPALAALAKENMEKMGQSATIHIGEFSTLLDQQVDLTALQPDFIFVDGNHRYEPTMEYFHRLLPHLVPGAILVFDDIYWSMEMKTAWKEIITYPDITISIDLFHLGICFYKRPQAKEDFKFRIRF